MSTLSLGRVARPVGIRVLCLVSLALGFMVTWNRPVLAQTAAAAPAPRQEALATVILRMSKDAGITVLADSASSLQRVTPPAEATTPANLESQIAAIVRQFPGSQWAKLMLPAPASGRSWKGDDVARFADAASRLYGNSVFSSSSMHPTPAVGLSVLAQPIPAERSTLYVSDLHLLPVYVIASTAAAAPIAGGTFTSVVDPQDIQNAIAHMPDGPMRDHVLEELKNDPSSVHIETDGNGGIRVMMHDHD